MGDTTYDFAARCRLCGTVRRERRRGWQRNPGECDERSYEAEAEAVDADALRRALRNRRARLRRAS